GSTRPRAACKPRRRSPPGATTCASLVPSIDPWARPPRLHRCPSIRRRAAGRHRDKSFASGLTRGGSPRLLDIRSTTRGPICSHTGRMRRFSTFARVSLVETITIDDLDRQLTQCLGVEGRASFSAIAAVLGVPDQPVARRYRRLRSAGVLRVVGLKYPKSAGYANWFLRLRCVPGSGEAIAAALAQRSDT